MIDFTENIDSLEKMVWNFILNLDNDIDSLRPTGHESLRREELISMVKPNYFNDENNKPLCYRNVNHWNPTELSVSDDFLVGKYNKIIEMLNEFENHNNNLTLNNLIDNQNNFSNMLYDTIKNLNS